MEQIAETYTYEMCKQDGKRARWSLIRHHGRIIRMHIRSIMNCRILGNSAVSLLLAFNFGLIGVAAIQA